MTWLVGRSVGRLFGYLGGYHLDFQFPFGKMVDFVFTDSSYTS